MDEHAEPEPMEEEPAAPRTVREHIGQIEEHMGRIEDHMGDLSYSYQGLSQRLDTFSARQDHFASQLDSFSERFDNYDRSLSWQNEMLETLMGHMRIDHTGYDGQRRSYDAGPSTQTSYPYQPPPQSYQQHYSPGPYQQPPPQYPYPQHPHFSQPPTYQQPTPPPPRYSPTYPTYHQGPDLGLGGYGDDDDDEE